MPLLDVAAEVLDDPFFQTQIIVTRTNVVGVDDNAREIKSVAAPVTMNAVVQPAGSRDLQRLADATIFGGAITIWARFAFTTESAFVEATPTTPAISGAKADKVGWRGSTYTVMTVDDWGEFGSGYYRALAVRQSIP